MVAPVSIYQGVSTQVLTGGTPVIAIYAGTAVAYLVNPSTAADQGISGLPEILYVDMVNPAVIGGTETTVPLYPGQSFTIPANPTTNVTVNAATSGHKFSCIVIQPQTPYPPTPTPGPFPPSAPTTQTSVIPSYLYQEYQTDDELQAFVQAYNQLAQEYINTFNSINLPIYTSNYITGALLDWVAEGLYGMTRPILLTGKIQTIGPFDTYDLNSITFNGVQYIGPPDVAATTDDIFKRIITWNFYKGDGRHFNIRYLKKRIARFLAGINGTDPPIDQTYDISVGFAGNQVIITLTNAGMYAPNFQGAMEAGALQFPFQFTTSVNVVE